MSKTLKSPDKIGSKRIKDCSNCPYMPHSTNNEKPAFSLAYLRDSHGIEKCTPNEKIAFLDALHTRSKMTWAELEQTQRHALGKENIERSAIHKRIPECVKNDTKLLAFRFNGNAPFVGFRDGKIFYVLWVDRDFTLYDHG